MKVCNGLSKATALLIRSVLSHGAPYVTYRQAARALLSAHLGHVTGGAHVPDYRATWTPWHADPEAHRAALVACGRENQS